MAAPMCRHARHLTRFKFGFQYLFNRNRRFFYTSASLNKMDTATVRINSGDKCLNITFRYGDKLIPERQFNFRRSPDESIKDSFYRITANLNKCYDKKKKKLKRKNDGALSSYSDISPPKVSMSKDGEDLSEDTLNSDAWNEMTLLNIGETTFKIEVNPPTIQSMKLSSDIMSGFPVHPCVDLEFANFNDSKFVWYKSKVNISEEGKDKTISPELSNIKWLPLTTEPIYHTNNSDIGHMLRIVCFPRLGDREGKRGEAVTEGVIGAGPGLCPYHGRHEHTKEKTLPDRYDSFVVF